MQEKIHSFTSKSIFFDMIRYVLQFVPFHYCFNLWHVIWKVIDWKFIMSIVFYFTSPYFPSVRHLYFVPLNFSLACWLELIEQFAIELSFASKCEAQIGEPSNEMGMKFKKECISKVNHYRMERSVMLIVCIIYAEQQYRNVNCWFFFLNSINFAK